MADDTSVQPWQNVSIAQVRQRLGDLLYNERLFAKAMNDQATIDMAKQVAFGLDTPIKDPSAQIALLKQLLAKMEAEQANP